jgi:spore cortex biosynthesis protein YabQ
MLFSSVNQIAETLTMIYYGILIGTLYDIFGILRRVTRKHKWVIHLLDIIFCAVSLAGFALFAYIANRGILKVYIFIGVLLGILLQFYGIKPIIKMISEFIFSLLGTWKKKIKNSGLYKRIIR